MNINNSNFINNITIDSGAIFKSSIDNLTMENIILKNNTATNGGAIYHNHRHGIINILNTSFVNNNARNNGGAIYNSNGQLLIIYSNLSFNRANDGSAIYNNNDSSLTFPNNLFEDNIVNNGRTISFKYGRTFDGNLFNGISGSNVYKKNIEQFDTSISIKTSELLIILL